MIEAPGGAVLARVLAIGVVAPCAAAQHARFEAIGGGHDLFRVVEPGTIVGDAVQVDEGAPPACRAGAFPRSAASPSLELNADTIEQRRVARVRWPADR